MNKRTVTLGGQNYVIQELPARKNSGWRKDLERRLSPLLDIIRQAGAGVELRNSEDIMKVVESVSQLLITAPDLLIEILFSYSPELRANQEVIMDAAYDSELIPAFATVLGMAYPFGSLVSLIRLASGAMRPQSVPISSSSPSLNGVHSEKSLTT